MPATLQFDLSTLDLNHVLADIHEIRKILPHRHHMEQLTAIVLCDMEQQLIVAYKDIGHDEFWVSGHMPGYPLFPGVLMCEAAAQLACYFTKIYGNMHDSLLGLGGLDNVRFRAPVRPGDRLVLVGKALRIHRRQTIFQVNGYVGNTMVFNGDVMGVPIPGQQHVKTELAVNDPVVVGD